MRTIPPISAVVFFALLASAQSGEDPPPSSGRSTPEPKTEKEYVLAGRSLLEKGQFKDAVPYFERAIAINPKNKRYYNNLGFCLKQLQRDDEAIAAFNQAIALDSKDSYAYFELGLCYYDKKDFNNAANFVRAAISMNPSDTLSHRWLGYIYYQLKDYPSAINALDEALKLRPDDFDANYWRGLTSLRLRLFADASRFLGKAAELRPTDFNANFWTGISLIRERKFKEALPSFQKAHEIKRDDKAARFELFACYLASNQPEKAARLFPYLIVAIGSALVFVYCIWLAALLPFSLPVRTKTFPGLLFSFAWLGLFLEGQVAFLLIGSLPWLGLHEVVLTGATIAGLPIIAVALTGFARQPWGEPFRWPPRFGSPKTILISILLMFFTVLIASGVAQLYVHATNKPFPLQRTIPLIRNALQANPVTAWLGIAFIIPCVEEILFRGLLFGAFQKIWGVTGAVLASSFLFVCIHLQIIGFLALFLLGLMLAWARLRSGSLGLPIVLHSLNNAIAMALLTFAPPVPTG